MKAAELRDMTPDQLREKLVALKKEAFNMRFQAATGQAEQTHKMTVTRRSVARVKTILNQKAVASAASETGEA
ncbi:MAG: large subunit ribosomal protein L29 [Paracoccaceae bacterium]|jgi:large subunit ribosomal protein L29